MSYIETIKLAGEFLCNIIETVCLNPKNKKVYWDTQLYANAKFHITSAVEEFGDAIITHIIIMFDNRVDMAMFIQYLRDSKKGYYNIGMLKNNYPGYKCVINKIKNSEDIHELKFTFVKEKL